MSVTRWDPWREVVSLREAMDNLLRESFVQPQGAGTTTGALGVALDVQETDNEYIVQAVLPGVEPENVQLQVTGDSLQIAGEVRPAQQESKQGQWLLRERRYGRFQRSLTLPMAVQSDQAEAEFEHGILTVTLPKAQGVRAKSIPIRASRGGQQIEAQSQTKLQEESG